MSTFNKRHMRRGYKRLYQMNTNDTLSNYLSPIQLLVLATMLLEHVMMPASEPCIWEDSVSDMTEVIVAHRHFLCNIL